MMLWHRALNYAYLLTSLTVFVYALTVFVLNPNIDLHPPSYLHNMIYGTAHKPFVMRVVVPVTVRGLVALTPQEMQTALNQALGPAVANIRWKPEYVTEYLWTIVVLGFMLAGFWAAMRYLLDQVYRPSLWVGRLIPLLAVALLPMFYKYVSYIYDFSTLMFYTLGLGLLARRQWRWYLVLYPLACLNKETTILLTLVFGLYFYSRLEKRLFAGLMAYQVVVFVIIKLALSYVFRTNPGASVEFHLLDYNLFLFIQPINPFYVGLAGALVVAVGYAWDEKPAFLKTALWVLVPLVGLTALFGFLDEWRDYYEAYPPILLLLCDTVGRVWGKPLLMRADV